MIKWLLILCLMFLSPGALAQGDALEQPVVTLPEYARVGEPFTVSWTKVEGAAFYSFRFENGDDVFFAADTDENTFTYHDMRLKAGAYQITVGVFPAGSARGSESLPMPLRIEEPAPKDAFAYQSYHMADGAPSAVSLTRYLGETVPETLTIPETVDSAILRAIYEKNGSRAMPPQTLPVVSLGSGVLKNNGALKEVTIPKCVKDIADDAFEGSRDLTLRGYTGSEAHRVAMEKGYNFLPLDDGRGDFEVTWKKPVLVNSQTAFTVKGKNIESVEIFVNGERLGYFKNEKGKKSFTASAWLDEPGEFKLNAIARLKNGEKQYSAYLPIEVTQKGVMPALEIIDTSAVKGILGDTPNVITVERGTNVNITVKVPKNGRYILQGAQTPDESAVYWYPGELDVKDKKRIKLTKDRQFTRLLAGSTLSGVGDYYYCMALKPDKGYARSIAAVTIHLLSTRPFEYLEDQKAIFNYQGEETAVTLPLEIDGMPVTTLYDRAFAGSRIESVVIPEGVTRIRSPVFAGCENLTAVTLPKSLTMMLDNVFEGCTALETVELPPDVSLPSGLFTNCTALREVVMPKNLTALAASKQGYVSPFKGCDALEKVTFSAKTKVLENGCLPKGVTICAPKGSEAEKYAKRSGNPFEPLK